MNKTLKLTLITIAIIILGFVGYKVIAAELKEPKPHSEYEKFMSEWMIAGQSKFEQIEEENKARLQKALKNVSVSTGTISTGFTN